MHDNDPMVALVRAVESVFGVTLTRFEGDEDMWPCWQWDGYEDDPSTVDQGLELIVLIDRVRWTPLGPRVDLSVDKAGDGYRFDLVPGSDPAEDLGCFLRNNR